MGASNTNEVLASTYATGNTTYGLILGNQISKEFKGLAGKKASNAAGVADKNKVEQEQKDLENKRRSFAGLNYTSPWGVLNPQQTQRRTLGGF